MRRSLVDCCRRQGLAVIGYSGRDASIMAALEEALDEGRGFPGGLFWFKRGLDTPYSAVTALIARARALGIDAHLVEAESFDELFSDLLRFLPQTADKLASLAGATRPRLATAKPRPSTGPVPAIRMNALAVPRVPRSAGSSIARSAVIRRSTKLFPRSASTSSRIASETASWPLAAMRISVPPSSHLASRLSTSTHSPRRSSSRREANARSSAMRYFVR